MKKNTNFKSQKAQPKGKSQQKVKKIKKTNPPNRKTTKKVLVQVTTIPRPITTRDVVSVQVNMDPSTMPTIFASLYGYFANKGFATRTHDIEPEFLAGGFGYCLDILVASCRAAAPLEQRAPQLILDLAAALYPKDANFLTNATISYSWSNLPTWMFPLATQGMPWYPNMINGMDDETYMQPAQNVSYNNPQAYSAFLAWIGGQTLSDKLKIQSTDYKSSLSRDVSAFARSYVYNGQNGSQSAGFYKDVESEVNITAPMLSNFIAYGADDRVPLKLNTAAGDAALMVGLPLYPSLCPTYWNKVPPVFKLIDFDHIYTVLCLYMVNLIERSEGVPGIQFDRTAPLQMTAQDFRIVLRQALLNVFEHQHMVQFITPLTVSGGPGINSFAPFYVNGSSCANSFFSDLLVPKLLQENLGALRSRTIYNPKIKSKINRRVVIPVLGYYTLDTPPTFQYKTPDGLVPLFLTPTPAQNTIELQAGSAGNTTCYNLNGVYYQKTKENWNYYVQKLGAVSTEVTSIVGDQGPLGLGLLFYTSIINEPLFTDTVTVPTLQTVLYAGALANAKPKQIERINSKKDVTPLKAIPAATLVSLSIVKTTSVAAHTSEEMAILDFLISPSIRLDPSGIPDAISDLVYQTEVREPHSTVKNPIPSPSGASLYSRLAKMASAMVPGIAKTTSTEYDKAIQFLSSEGQAGFLAGLLGGLAKNFLPPDLHGVVDSVSSIVPF